MFCLYLQWMADCKVDKVLAKEGTNKEIGYRKYYDTRAIME